MTKRKTKHYSIKNAPSYTSNDELGIVHDNFKGDNYTFALPTYDEYGEKVGFGTDKYPYVLPETVVYPNNVTLTTYYPFNPHYLIGHSSVQFKTSNPKLKNGLVNTKSSDPNYNLITNNCSDDTRKVLEDTFGIPLDYNLFTTPGDVRDYFKERGATIKHKKVNSKNNFSTTQVMPISEHQYRKGIAAVDSINDLRRFNRKSR